MYPSSESPSDLQANLPSQALMFTMYSPTFGNYSFVTTPPQPGQLSDQFPSFPYLSLEALLYMSQSSNPQTSPATVIPGAVSNTQNITGTTLQSDGTGQPRLLSGYQSSNITPTAQ